MTTWVKTIYNEPFKIYILEKSGSLMIAFFQPLKWKLYKTNKKKIKLKWGVVNLGTRQPVWQQSFLFRFSQAGETHESIGGYGGKKLGAPFYYMPLRVSRASSGKRKKVQRG